MATNIFLGYPPENIKQFIIDNYGPKEDPMLKVPLHFVAEEPGATMSFSIYLGNCEISTTGKEDSWVPYNSGDTITLANVGDKVYFRHNGNDECKLTYPSHFIIRNGKIAAKGNITSLIDKTLQKMDVYTSCY